MSKVKVFVSYSHHDARYLEAEGLIGFLRGLERDVAVEFWLDDSLRAGDHWDDTIQQALRTSHIALLLVSQAFLDSPYCQQVEVSTLLSRQPGAGLRLFPVVLSACEWERHAWLAGCQLLPGGQETLEENYREPGPQKRMFLKVRNELRALIEQVAQTLDQPPADKPAEVNAELRTVTLLHCCLSVDRLRYGLDPGEQLEFLYEAAPLFKECCLSELELLGGYVVQMSDAGQVLACFGYPEAQELDSVKAVRAGLAILRAAARLNQRLQQEWGAQLTVRAGVHTGQVIGKTGADTQQQLEHGQTSALTTLVMQAAPADALAVSQTTYNLVTGFFTAAPCKTTIAADALAPVELWTVTADLGLNTRFEANAISRHIELVGRQHELDLMLARWATARTGKGQLVAVSAESGLGKSRLIQEVRREIRRTGSRVFDCQCSLFTRNSPLAPVSQLLARWLDFKPDDGEADRLRKVQSLVAYLGLPPDEVVPYLAELLLLPHEQQAQLAQLTPQQLKERTHEAILAVVLQAAAQAPLALVVEDLQWADSSTLDCLNLLVGALPLASIYLIVSGRPEFGITLDWQAQDYFSLIKLDQLSREKVLEMVGRLAQGRELPREVFEAIYGKTEGYPLFIEELTQMVLGSGQLLEQDGRYVLARPFESLAIPDTLHESLMARLNRLEGGRIIAQIGAVLGREFSFELLQQVAPLDADTLKELLARLVNSGLFYRKGLLSKSVYMFKHALVQEALYESLLRKERKRYHQLAAAALAAVSGTPLELLAYHYHAADAHEQAVEYGLLASAKVARESANVEVLHHVRDALKSLAHLPEGPRRDRLERQLLLLQGPALQALRGVSAPEYSQNYERARSLCQDADDRRELFRVNRGLWFHHAISSQLSESVRMAEQLMALAEAADDNDLRLEACACYCGSYYWQGRPLQALAYAERGLALYDRPAHHLPHALEFGMDPGASMLTFSLNVLRVAGPPAQAAARLATLREHLAQATHLFSKCYLLYGLGLYYSHTADPQQTLPVAAQLQQLGTSENFPHWLALGYIFGGWASVRLDHGPAGLATIREGIAIFTNSGGLTATGLSAYLLADAHLHLQQHVEALHHIESVLSFLAQTEEHRYLPELLHQKAAILQVLTPGSPDIELALQQARLISQTQELPVLLHGTAARVAG